ncbi:MAG: hypothetical protein IKN17_01430 [Ruminococcus sp.]|nr:hypothetical protein [Ruminococcus sp.]
MSVTRKLRLSLAAGTACAVMLVPFGRTFFNSSLFFPSFVLGACSQQTEDDDEVEYGFALLDFIFSLFG